MKYLAVILLATTCWAQQSAPFDTNWNLTKNEVLRGKKKLLWLVGSSILEQAANHYDTVETLRGIRAGVAVEGNTWLVGTHPSVRALYLRDAMTLGIIVSPSLVAYKFRKMPFFYAGCVGPLVMGIKHVNAGKKWQSLINGKAPAGSELGP
jgi:hypothetical protein